MLCFTVSRCEMAAYYVEEPWKSPSPVELGRFDGINRKLYCLVSTFLTNHSTCDAFSAYRSM